MQPAHPSAQVVTRESLGALDRLLKQIDILDTKASYLAAGAFVLTAGFIAAAATKPPTNPHVQDAMVAALILYLATLGCALFTWWPRLIDVPPHPCGLREKHWNDREENVLLQISNQIAVSFDDTKKVASRKAAGIKAAVLFLLAGASVSAAVVAVDLIQGATH